MASPTSGSSSTAKGYEPPAKKQKLLLSEADRAEQYLAVISQGRVVFDYAKMTIGEEAMSHIVQSGQKLRLRT